MSTSTISSADATRWPGRELSLVCACLLVGVASAASSPYFATWGNLATVLRNAVELLLVSLGMTLLLAMGSIDVSVGMVMGIAAIAVGRVLEAGLNPLVAIVSGPVVGGLLGLLTAAVVVWGRIPAIVGSLGLLGVYRAAIFALLGGSWLSGLPSTLTAVAGGTFAGVPVAAVVIAGAYGLVWVALRRTAFGPHLLAIGNAEERARLAGVAVKRTRTLAFVASGVLCGLAGVFYVSTYRNVAMTIGGGVALEAVAAVVLGGTSVRGGRCSLLGTAVAVLMIRVVQNALVLVGVPSLWQAVVTGMLLIVVLATEATQGRLRMSSLARRAG